MIILTLTFLYDIQVKFEGVVNPGDGYIAISQVYVENRFCREGYHSFLNPGASQIKFSRHV